MKSNAVLRVFRRDDMKRLFLNIYSLGILQASNYILPLLTVPYLIRVLGFEYFGLLAFANATIGFLILIVDYGFNLSATRQIALYRNNENKISEIYSSVMVARITLIVISFFLLLLLIASINRFSLNADVFLVCFGLVIGHGLFPIWLFQGMEAMKYITYLNISAKLFFTICVFVLVNEKGDYILVPLFTSIGSIIVALWSLCIIRYKLRIELKIVEFTDIWNQFVEGWHVFYSNIAISAYTISAPLILGLFTNNVVVGCYSASEKIIMAVRGLYSPISQAIYPMISRKLNENKKEGMLFVRKYSLWVGVPMLIVSIFLYFISEYLIVLLVGEENILSIELLKVMSFLPFIVTLSNILGIHIMLNVGLKKEFSLILFAAAILSLCLSFLFVPVYGALATSSILVIIEMSITIFMTYVVYKRVVL